jgi:hypothetical protein
MQKILTSYLLHSTSTAELIEEFRKYSNARYGIYLYVSVQLDVISSLYFTDFV